MSLDFTLLDVFADTPFQGTQIPVVVLESAIDEATKIAIASEFRQTETVFFDNSNKENPVSVYDSQKQTTFGSHTILAASYIAQEAGLTHDEGEFSVFQIKSGTEVIESFIDHNAANIGTIQYRRTLSPVIDNYTPDLASIAKALATDEKHITFSKYRPLLVSVDHPVLIIPFTKPEHILAADLKKNEWSELLSDIYASEIFMFAPGSISGATDFHGRIVNPSLAKDDYPPVGKVMPEFIAYLAQQGDTAEGTHTFSIDRGSNATRKSVLHAEFDKRKGKETQCRIGGNVIKMGEGKLFI